MKRTVKRTEKKAYWVVKVYTDYKTGWQDLKRFDNAQDADEWLCNFIRESGCSYTDINLVRREA